ncbi:MAG: hypothetical protein ABI867_43065 [Kofleriaceae bacterium]
MRRLVWVFLAGCWATTPPPREPLTPPDRDPQVTARTFPRKSIQPPCVVAIDHALEIVRPELEQIPQMKDRLDLVHDAAIASCQAMQWNDDTIACFANAVDSSEMRNCQAMLSTDQNGDLGKRMTDVMTKPVP